MEVLEQQTEGAAAGDRPRITTRYMTKYERARVLGTRALQIRCAPRGAWRDAGGSNGALLGRCGAARELTATAGGLLMPLCSMNAPVMVALDGETDPLEVRGWCCRRVAFVGASGAAQACSGGGTCPFGAAAHASDCHEGAAREEDPLHHPAVPPRRQVRRVRGVLAGAWRLAAVR